MDHVLIVASSDKGIGIFTDLLNAQVRPQIRAAYNGGEARRLLVDGAFDLVIVNTPLQDEFGHELAVKITSSTTASCVLVVKNEIADDVSAKVEDYGVFVVAKPISKVLFFQALKLITASRNRMMGLQNQNIKLHQKIEEIRLVDRAKCALIQYLNLTEQQAHKHIEKQAMDMRVSRREIAEGILKTYEG
ncbi:ANTAR domain-containing response regulator [Candidatus Soleaferrea massiliensis]|uniref:ANTAR domain-containing response regulator n=1 Tax=Candidatus Soleaferrea massiliensis TaxID=1470354 RepID=UPI00058EEBBF|nr:ANTAR domain-containing protein [Candidatus Soleaferrea massiliensis]